MYTPSACQVLSVRAKGLSYVPFFGCIFNITCPKERYFGFQTILSVGCVTLKCGFHLVWYFNGKADKHEHTNTYVQLYLA